MIMPNAKAYAAQSATAALAPWSLERRDPGPSDVAIEILFCGVCHSDLHTARNEWRNTIYPCVPGHEIVGRVTKVGRDVKKFREGEHAAVGCMVDSCRTCTNCQAGLEQFCEKGMTLTYNSADAKGKPGQITWPPPPRCSARASRPTRRCATGRSARARKSAWSVSAGWGTWA
jgi:uncharacterized zinc-type alcohol dehydrogenase-like protein